MLTLESMHNSNLDRTLVPAECGRVVAVYFVCALRTARSVRSVLRPDSGVMGLCLVSGLCGPSAAARNPLALLYSTVLLLQLYRARLYVSLASAMHVWCCGQCTESEDSTELGAQR